jgi:ketosteroid isomerase-like protein
MTGIAIAILLTACSGMDLPQASDSADVRRSIESAEANFVEAFNRGDVEALVEGFYADDATLYPPNGAPVSGKQAILAFWGGLIEATSSVVVSLTPQDIEHSGNIAYEIGVFTLDMQFGEGPMISDTGNYVIVWKQQSDGSWKASEDIWNSNLPVEP